MRGSAASTDATVCSDHSEIRNLADVQSLCQAHAGVGLGVALDYALGWGMGPTWERVQGLAGLLRGELAEIPGVTVRDLGAEQCGIVTFTVDGIAPTEVQRRLAARAINVTVSTVASTRFDMEARGLAEVVRSSLHYYNDEAEVDRFVAAVRAITVA